MCKCYKIEQAINHHDIKVSRQEARKEIEFGLEQKAELDDWREWDDSEYYTQSSRNEFLKLSYQSKSKAT